LEDEFTEESERAEDLSTSTDHEVTTANITLNKNEETEKPVEKSEIVKDFENILKESKNSNICEDSESTLEAVNDSLLCENLKFHDHKRSLGSLQELKDKENIKVDIKNLENDTVHESAEPAQTCAEDTSSTESKNETHAEEKGGNNITKDMISPLKLRSEEHGDYLVDTVSSISDTEPHAAPIDNCRKQHIQLNENINRNRSLENNLNNELQSNKNSDEEVQEVYPEEVVTHSSHLKESMDMREKVNDSKISMTLSTSKKGNQVQLSSESTSYVSDMFDKEDIEPPPLKIRIFKGHSGELINEKEAKRSRKRKKKTEKQKAKIAKLNSETEHHTMSNAAEENTQNRICQELPGCNWLEQKIKNGAGSDTRPSQLDALLETDSDDDCLVVDDQSEACEVSTSCNEVEFENAETTAEKVAQDRVKENSVSENPVPPAYKNHTEMDLTKKHEVGYQMNANGNHPLTYMLGNLMKKMDKKRVEREPGKTVDEKLVKENRKRDYSSIEKTNNGGILDGNQITNSNTKPEEMKQYPQLKLHKQTEFGNTMSRSDKNDIFEAVEKPTQPVFEQNPQELRKNMMPTSNSMKIQNSYERTVEESRAARQNAQNLYFREQMMERKRLEDQLLKDIEDLKNKKIKEMEDLIEIKTKKEQTMTDLEKLKLEIEKNKTFLESLKKINLREEIKISPHSSSQLEEEKDVRMKSTANTNAPIRHAPADVTIEKQLPDLVNHEKMVASDKTKQQNYAPETVQFSQEYLLHMQRMNEKNNKPAQHAVKIAVRTPPPQILPKQIALNQSQVSGTTDSQIYFANNLRPQSLPNNIQAQNQQQPVPMLLPNQILKSNKYGTNIQNFFPGYENKKEQEENDKNNQRPSHPRGITRMQSDSGILLRQPPAKEQTTDIKKVVAEGFIRPRAFSREENISPPSELSKLMTNMNSQYSARNINTLTRQDIAAKRNFPEIRNAIAASSERRLSQPNVRTPTPTGQSQTAPREPVSLLSKCAVCTRVANFLCSGCQTVYYCTVQCQSKHWLVHYNKCVGARS